MQKSPIVTANPKPTRPSVAVSPTATEEDLRVCTTLNAENRRLVAFETANYLVNVCQKGTQGRIFYLGQQKGKSNGTEQITAAATQQGYRASNGSTTYVVDTRSGGKLIVLQDGQLLLQEPAIGTVITADKPEPPKAGNPGADFRTCTGGINNRDLYFTVVYTQEKGFTTFELRQKGSDRLISKGSVAVSGKNNQGQTIYRGAAKDARQVSAIELARRSGSTRVVSRYARRSPLLIRMLWQSKSMEFRPVAPAKKPFNGCKLTVLTTSSSILKTIHRLNQ